MVSTEPLVKLADDTPLLFPVLACYVQLEPAEPSDAARFEKTAELVLDWIGSELKWTHTTVFSCPEPFRATDFDYFVDHASATTPPEMTGDRETDEMLIRHQVLARLDFSMGSKGGLEDIHASPFSFAFHCDIPDDKHALALDLPTCLMVTVPVDWPLDDFGQRFRSLLGLLRVRWANAGYSYSGWDDDFYDEVHDGIYAHARRHPGFDVPEFVEQGVAFHENVRSVSWLTFVGPRLRPRLAPSPRLYHATVEETANGLLVQAGATPGAGDTNRRDFPSAYCEADAVVRRVRAPGPSETVDFLHPWTVETTATWLHRFER